MPPKMTWTALASTPAETESPAAQNIPTQISWGGARDCALAGLLKDNWSLYESYGGKLGLCRKWAKQLGIGDLDESGYKTKAHIKHMISKYKRARQLKYQAGAGTIQIKVKKGNKKVMVDRTLEEQVVAICPVYKILEGCMETRESVELAEGLGSGENGLMTRLGLNKGKDSEVVPQVDIWNEDVEEPITGGLFDGSEEIMTQTLLDNIQDSQILSASSRIGPPYNNAIENKDDQEWDSCDDDEELESNTPVGLEELRMASPSQATPRGKRVGGNESFDFMQSLLMDSLSTREHRQKIAELRIRARIAKHGGGTEEQRKHELEVLKIQNEMKRHELELANQMRSKELELANQMRCKELEVKRLELELEIKQLELELQRNQHHGLAGTFPIPSSPPQSTNRLEGTSIHRCQLKPNMQ